MKKILSLTVCILVCLSASAYNVSGQDAFKKAQDFLRQKGKSAVTSQLSTRGGSADDAPYYVFNAEGNNGFVIVSGDDSAPDILGYVPSGSFDSDKIPDNMKAWLNGYAEEIAYLRSHPATRAESAAVDRPSIEPLLTCKWNQSYPYNNKCTFTPNKCYTGCVATAMAQILYHHRYNSVNSIQADIPSYVSRRGLKIDGIPAGSVIDWGNMFDVYDWTQTPEQEDAVANLMLYCGVSVEMDYGSDMSAARISDAATALVKYFGYSQQVKWVNRLDYVLSDWYDLMYYELSNNRPVLYSGKPEKGEGHIFVVDGYSKDDNSFHINWGWGGYCDGFFSLALCNPADGGIGGEGFQGGFKCQQYAVINAEPSNNNEISNYHLDAVIYRKGTGVTIRFENTNPVKGNFDYGIGYLGNDGEIIPLECCSAEDLNTNMSKDLTYDIVLPDDVSERHFVPISKLTGTSEWYISWSRSKYILAQRVGDGSLILSIEPKPDLAVTDFRISKVLKAKMPVYLELSLLNTGDKECLTKIYLTDDKGMKIGEREVLLLREGESGSYSFYWTPSESGDYTLTLGYGSSDRDPIFTTEVKIENGIDNYSNAGVVISDVNLNNSDMMALYEDDDHQGVVIPVTDKGITGSYLFQAMSGDRSKMTVITNLLKYNESTGTYEKYESGNPVQISGSYSFIYYMFSKEIKFSFPNLTSGKYKIEVVEGSDYSEDGTFSTVDATIGVYRVYLEVPPTLMESLSISSSSHYIKENESIQLTANVYPEDTADKSVTWSSSDEAVATVDRNGLLTGCKAGEAIIYAVANDGSKLKAEWPILVSRSLVESITIADPDSRQLKAGQTLQLKASVLPDKATDKSVSWSSSNEGVATVDKDGLVTAKAVGKVEITAIANDGSGVKGSISIEVIPTLVESVSIKVPEKSELKVDESLTLTVSVLPEDATDKTVVWSSSNESVATVDQNGIVTAKSIGSAVITATANDGSGVKASFEVKVVPTPVSAISIYTPEKSELRIGESVSLTCSVSPDKATDKSVTWSSSDASVASVDADGNVVAKGIGTAVISVMANDGSGVSDSVTITVVPVLAEGITIKEPEKTTIEAGETLQLIAVVSPDNATDKSVVWSSSNEDVATVDGNGLVTAVASGQVSIVANDSENHKAEIKLEVTPAAGVDDISLDEVKVNVEGLTVRVETPYSDIPVMMYSLTGSTIPFTSKDSCGATFEAPTRGIYIISISYRSIKIRI